MQKTQSSKKPKPLQRERVKPVSSSPGAKPRAAAKVDPKAEVVPRSNACSAGDASAAAVKSMAMPIFHLGSSLAIKDVEDAHRRLAAAFAGDAALTVDVGRVGTVDTAGVQLLLAFQSEAIKRGVSVQFRGESAALTHAMTVLGLGAAIRIATAHD